MGARVASFKAPTPEELQETAKSPDGFLKRIERESPKPGEIVIFNRSQLEDVLVLWVNGAMTPEVRAYRMQAINDFELKLTGQGVTILKFYLHISKKEQLTRLVDRLKEPDKRWKVSLSDWKARNQWDDYRSAYESALVGTSTRHAPWMLVPADAKWFRDLWIAGVVKKVMEAKLGQWQGDVVFRGKVSMEFFKVDVAGRESLLDEVDQDVLDDALGREKKKQK
jgi:polyphosphate kinase 2 (PPK2 family)